MIKLIAVDMDGTFLRSDMTYDRSKFNELYQQMKDAGVRFVVASGNQYFQLRSFFDQYEEFPFVAENGAYVRVGDEDLFVGDMKVDLVRQVLEVLCDFPSVETILCGKNSAYTKTKSREAFEFASKYYHRIKQIQSFGTLPNDQFLKFALTAPVAEVPEVVLQLEEALGEHLIPVSSGHESIDLILPGVNKARGLAILGEKYGIQPEEMAAFGDSGNDKEMLSYVGHGFAMGNAQEQIKEISKKVIGTNEEDSVLATISDIAANNWEYPY